MWASLALIGIVTFLIYNFLISSNNFWKRYNIRQYKVASFSDNLAIFLGKKIPSIIDITLYKKLGTEKLGGFVQMRQPIVLIKDLEIAKQILIKDFEYFIDRRPFATGKHDNIVDKMISNLKGDEWKGVRSSMSPAFTTGKIRRMMDHFNQVAGDWVEHFKSEINKTGKTSIDIEVSDEAHRFTVDAIAAAGFGLKPETVKDKNSTFYKMVGKAVKLGKVDVMKFALALNFPKVVKLLGISVFNVEALNFFEEMVGMGLKERQSGKLKMNDFLQLIVESRKGEMKGVGKDDLDEFEKDSWVTINEKRNYLGDDEMAKAQAIAFFFAGFNTTANFIGFAMYALALNQEVQDRLRKEINEKLFENGEKEIDYDKLNRLVYLDMVVCEILRKYPNLGRLERVCVKDNQFDGTNMRIPKGSLVVVPVMSIHNDKRYYERPDDFYPEHFSPEKKAERNPYAFLPFGGGPRSCIGMRLALVEGKAAIAHLIHNFIIEPSKNTPIPVKVKNVAFRAEVPDELEVRLVNLNCFPMSKMQNES